MTIRWTARWTDHEWYCFAHQSGYCSCRSGHLNTDEMAERARLVAERTADTDDEAAS